MLFVSVVLSSFFTLVLFFLSFCLCFFFLPLYLSISFFRFFLALCFSFICLSGFNVFVGSVCYVLPLVVRLDFCLSLIVSSVCLSSFLSSTSLFLTFLLSLFLLVSSVCLPYLYLPPSFHLCLFSHTSVHPVFLLFISVSLIYFCP